MATAFPGALDNFTNITLPAQPTKIAVGGRTHSAFHNDNNDALEALQAKIGVDNSNVSTSLDNIIKRQTPVAIQNQSYTSATATGAVNAFVLALTPAITTYTPRMRFSVIANLTNTGACTLNAGGGFLPVRKQGGTVELAPGDIIAGQVFEVTLDNSSVFELQTPVSNLSPVNITGQTEVSFANENDEFLVYNQVAGANRKVKQRGLVKFGGTGADGVIDGTANITIAGTDYTLIERNYTSWSAGTAPRVFTVTPRACILYIRIKGNADFNNWTFNLAGKGGEGGPAVTFAGAAVPGITGGSSGFFINRGGGGSGGGGTGGGGGASPIAAGSAGNASSGGSLGGVSSLQSADLFTLLRTANIDGGGGGGSGSAANTGNSGAGGSGGGCIIIEVIGNLSLTGSAITVAGTNGANAVGAGCGGGGGGGGGGVLILYSGNLVGSVSPTVTGGTAGTGNLPAGAGANGISRILKNNYLT